MKLGFASAFAFLLFGITAGCDDSGPVNSVESIEKAEEFWSKGDPRSAIIQLKKVLQKDPDSAPARLLLGQVHLDLGDGATAEKEIVRAQGLGAKSIDTLKPLGKAWLLQRKPENIVDQFVIAPESAASLKAIIHALRGDAFTRLRQPDKAETAYKSAIAAYKTDLEVDRPHLKLTEPAEHVDAVIGLARLAVSQRKWETAKSYLDRAEALAPKSAEMLAAKGLYNFSQAIYEESEKAYKAAFAIQPYNAGFQIRIGWSQLGLRRYEDAIENFDKVLAVFPNHRMTNHLRSLTAYQMQDFATAKLHAEKIINSEKPNISAFLIGGGASYGLGQFEQAGLYLKRYLSQRPNDQNARVLLGKTLIKLGQPEQATAILQATSDSRQDDATMLATLGAAAIKAGDLDTGLQHFEKLMEINPDNMSAKAQIGVTHISMGDRERGIRELEEATKADSSLLQAEANLIKAYITSGKLDDALKASIRMQERAPDNALGHVLEGLVLLAKGQTPEGKSAFEKALELSPGDTAASHGLATIAIEADQFDIARDLYKKALEHTPNHLATLLHLANIAQRTNDQAERIEWLKQAVSGNPASVYAATMLARAFVETGDPISAVTATLPALRLEPDNLALLEVAGKAQLDSKQPKLAIPTYERLVVKAPKSIDAHLYLAQSAMMGGQPDKAKTALDALIKLDPEHRAGMLMRAQLALKDRDLDTTAALLARLEQSGVTGASIERLRAGVATLQKNPEAALNALTKLLTIEASTMNLRLLTDMQLGTGKLEDAIVTLNSWLEKHPTDQVARIKLGGIFLQLKQCSSSYKLEQSAA